MKINIVELFMAKRGKNGWDTCFTGTIKRETDENDNQVLSGKIYVKNDSFDEIIYARISDSEKSTEELQDQLGEQFDEIVKMILDCGLTKMPAKTEVIEETTFFLN